MHVNYDPKRRQFLRTVAAAPLVLAAPRLLATGEFNLVAAEQRVSLVGQGYPDTLTWGYNGSVPGPVIRARRGEPLRIRVSNQLEQPTTVHWHGLRIRNDMDGVPGLTQPPIEPGQAFLYAFTPPDAGTFWYHSHVNSSEQIGRGLYGALIVEEESPPKVDRDVVWVLDDWLLDREARIVDAFDHPRDASHAGQIGNTVTINGRIMEQLEVRTNERIRLRLINVANARIFRLRFEGLKAYVVALDGQPVVPHSPSDDMVVLGPAMRTDLILDCTGAPGDRVPVVDQAYREPYRLVDIAHSNESPLRAEPLPMPEPIAGNDLPLPTLAGAEQIDIAFGGGVHGQLEGASYRGQWLDLRSLFRQGKMWAINGIVGGAHTLVPLFELSLGRTYVFHMVNQSVWPHPIHLHGYHFQVLRHNGEAVGVRPWRDTVLLENSDSADVAFVADNPGDWMFHCHIPEHMAAGMTCVIRVGA